MALGEDLLSTNSRAKNGKGPVSLFAARSLSHPLDRAKSETLGVLCFATELHVGFPELISPWSIRYSESHRSQ